MSEIAQKIGEFIRPEDNILSLGCGVLADLEGLKFRTCLGIDCFSPYLHAINQRQDVILLYDNVLNCFDHFLDDSFDAVIAIDFLEHLELSDAEKCIKEMKRIARRVCVIYTPSVFVTNEQNVCPLSGPYSNFPPNISNIHKCLLSVRQLSGFGFVVTPFGADKGIFAVHKNHPHNLP